MSSAKRSSRWQKATALLPLALLSGAWTTSLTMTGTATAEDATAPGGKLPDGTSVPQEAIKDPASVGSPGQIAPGIPTGGADKVIAGASANGIPAAALSAYQRAAQVIDKADKGCNIDWTLIGAIGRVESNHGRYGGNTLTGNGVSTPGIYGIPLNGGNNTAKISDTDGGQYDKDPVNDRAVGPMQFIPSTWAVVGVDGDGDGKRNPQDIDDAALATAVYLCSGNENLSTAGGQRSAIYRYNHSNDYVALVMSIARAYAKGDFASVPTSSAGATTMTPDYGDSVFASGTSGYRYPKGRGYGSSAYDGSSSGGSSGAKSGGSSSGSTGSGTTPTPSSPSLVPQPSGGSGGSSGGSDTAGETTKTVKKTVKKVTDKVDKTTKDPVGETKKTLTYAEAKAKCLANGISVLDVAKLNACIADLTK